MGQEKAGLEAGLRLCQLSPDLEVEPDRQLRDPGTSGLLIGES